MRGRGFRGRVSRGSAGENTGGYSEVLWAVLETHDERPLIFSDGRPIGLSDDVSLLKTHDNHPLQFSDGSPIYIRN